MSQRLFRCAELMANKYDMVSYAVKHRPMSARQERQRREEIEKLKQKQEQGALPLSELDSAKSSFIDFVNVYLSPSDTPIKNPYSTVASSEFPGKNKLFSALYTFGHSPSREIGRILKEIFPDFSGNLDHISPIVLSNRIKRIYDILIDPEFQKSAASLLRARFREDYVTEGTGAYVSQLNGLVQFAKEKLQFITKTLQVFSEKGKAVEDPSSFEPIETPLLIRDIIRVIRGEIINDETRMLMGIEGDKPDSHYISMIQHDKELGDLLKAAFFYAKRNSRTAPAIAAYTKLYDALIPRKQREIDEQEKRKSTVFDRLERIKQREREREPSESLWDKPSSENIEWRQGFSPIQEQEIYEEMKRRKARESGEGSGEGGL
jgi:hypothetical protein